MMNLLNILNVAIALGVGFVLLLGMAILLIGVRRRISKMREDPTTRNLEIEIGNLKMSIAELGMRLAVVERDMSTVPQRPRGNINLSKRGQVLRLHRRGDAAPEIASAVGLRRGEVELIIKLQKLSFAGQGNHVRV